MTFPAHVVDAEHALVVGSVAMLLSASEARLAGVLRAVVTTELDHDGLVALSSATVTVNGDPRYRIHVEAVRD